MQTFQKRSLGKRPGLAKVPHRGPNGQGSVAGHTIDDVLQRFASLEAGDLRFDMAKQGVHVGRRRRMRTDDDVLHRPKRAVGRQRFDLENIERGGSENPGFKRGYYSDCVLVLPTDGIDERRLFQRDVPTQSGEQRIVSDTG